jgi:hypothetical protein
MTLKKEKMLTNYKYKDPFTIDPDGVPCCQLGLRMHMMVLTIKIPLYIMPPRAVTQNKGS